MAEERKKAIVPEEQSMCAQAYYSYNILHEL